MVAYNTPCAIKRGISNPKSTIDERIWRYNIINVEDRFV